MFSCNLPPALLTEWPGSFACYCGNRGVEEIPKWVSTKSWPCEENSPAASAGLELATFRSRVRRSNHWAISAPQTVWVQSKFTSYMTVSHIDWNGHQNGYRNMTVSHLDWNGYRNGYRNMTVSHIDWNGYQNGYWNTSQHWKLTLEKKILPSLLPGLKPVTFRSHVRRRRSTTELSPLSVMLWSCRPFSASQN